MVELLDARLCCGCSACANICPHKAITMVENSEGFLYPKIDETKCVNCGLCQKACPILHKTNNNFKKPNCYAAMADDEIRKVSSSGGAFSIIADYILEKKGYICGCAFDEKELKAKHIIINSKEDLYKLRGSKYVQSDMGTCYQEVKNLLENGSFVLFSGTPCQIAGLKSFLRKEYETLLTVDILCHGVPSPKVYRKYLNGLLQTRDEKVIKVNFRDKVRGWSPTLTNTTTTTTTTTYSYTQVDDTYMQLFLSNVSLRENCTDCKFCTTQREGDFTIADFWGIEKYDKNLNDGKGTSLILLNNNNAKEIYKKIEKNFKLSQPVPLKYAILGNRNLYAPHKVHPKREEFFQDLDRYSLKQLVNKYLLQKYDCGIMNFWATWNYGAILTCYALQEVVKRLGFTTQVINYVHKSWHNKKIYKYTKQKEQFVNANFNLTNLCKNKKDLKKLNKTIDSFIVGSDQVWRWAYPLQYLFYLDYVNSDKKKIACSVSMINEYFCQADDVKTVIEYYIKRFDAISVREYDCIKYCKEEFGVDSVCIIDPVFWLNQTDYSLLIEKEENIIKNTGKYIAVYLIDKNAKLQELLEEYKRKNNINIIYLNNGESIEQWLAYIKNAEFIITDSFHGTCFSIIFEKQFLVYTNNRGNSRLTSLFALLNIKNNIYNKELTFQELEEAIVKKIDYKNVNIILEKQIETAYNWIRVALNSPKNKFKENIEFRFLSLLLEKGRIPKGLPNRIIKLKPLILKLPKFCLNMIKKRLFLITENINVLKI